MFSPFNKKDTPSIYQKLVVIDENLSLKSIIKQVMNELTEWKKDDEQNREMINNIKLAVEGDLKYKKWVKNEITTYLIKNFPQIKEETIDSIIKQYYLNYYCNLFADEVPSDPYERNIYEYFNRFVISENSSLERKYQKLVSIIFQENWGLGAIDELAEDRENINGVWTNSRRDIRIQYKGLKRRVKNIFFENNKSYENAIINFFNTWQLYLNQSQLPCVQEEVEVESL